LTISDRDLADLAYAGLLDIHKAKLEGQEFLDVSQVFQKALANESRVKESGNLQSLNENVKRHVHLLNYESDNLDDCDEDVYAAEFTWLSKDTPHTCASLKLVHINRQDEMKFTYDVGKCYKIFDELLRIGKIKLSHAIPPIDDLKKRAYYKWHNSYSQATNDCNVFWRQIQSANNGGQLCLKKMQVDNNPFPVNALDLQGAKVLVWPE
jgi:hypothetical protein